MLSDLLFIDTPNYDWAKDEYIIIIDDIADTFNTISAIKKNYALKNAKEIKTCTLIDKPFRRDISDIPDFYCYTYLDSKFLVGYGMGLDDMYRHLRHIYELTFIEN